jgi:hypothetical protein
MQKIHVIENGKKAMRQSSDQADLDAWVDGYNRERPHSGRYRFGKTPMQTFENSMQMTKENC